MKKIIVPTAEQVVLTNKKICEKSGSSHACYGVGKIESAIHTALYPGSYPFAAGGIARIAGALCYYLTKSHAFMDGNKRTAALTAIVFLNQNGWNLNYSIEREENALATTIENCAAGKIQKEELMDWFDSHKVKQK